MGSIIDKLVNEIRLAAKFNPEVQVAPACILWPDRDRQWEAVIPRLQTELSELLVLGEYVVEKRMGPAIWLRCVMAGKVDEIPLAPEHIPIFYLPGVSRQDLRAVESCPEHLKPLAELQYRGAIWSQINAKDWTILSFLKSDQGGLGLDVAQDNGSKNAMQLAIFRLLDEDVALLKGKRLDKDYFNMLLTGGDPVRELLQWLDQGDTFRSSCGKNEWKAFVEVCKSQMAFNPDKEGVLACAARLAAHEGPWQAVWDRFCEAPRRYPNIPAHIRKCKAPRDNIFWSSGEGGFDGWPQWNEDREKNLNTDLMMLAGVPAHTARQKILELDKVHGRRRHLVWSELGEAALAQALEPLALLTVHTQNGLVAGGLQDVTAGYRSMGWQADGAVLRALSLTRTAQDLAAVTSAIRAIYLPWIEESARYLQKIVQETGYPGGTAATQSTPLHKPQECVLFVDGLRFDAAKKLSSLAAGKGCAVEEKPLWAALPTITASGKPAVTPVSSRIAGSAGSIDFEPCVSDTGQSLKTGYHLKKLITDAGWTILDRTESGHGQGHAWCEFGDIDHEGHDRGWKMAKHIDVLLREVSDRIMELLAAGWRQVRVVTDHGWLLLPGGLPKAELAASLVDNKWGRCAAIKAGASTDEKLYPWFWNPDVHVALADGVSCFRKGQEYTHGGLSFQECLTLELIITKELPGNEAVPVEFTDVVWKGLRCTVAVDGQHSRLSLDIRRQPGDVASSVVLNIKPIKDDGRASVVVEDSELEGTEASVVLLDGNGELVAQAVTVIGGGNP